MVDELDWVPVLSGVAGGGIARVPTGVMSNDELRAVVVAVLPAVIVVVEVVEAAVGAVRTLIFNWCDVAVL